MFYVVYSYVEMHKLFEENYCFHLQGTEQDVSFL